MTARCKLDRAAIVADLHKRPDVPGKIMAHEHGCSESTISLLRKKHGLSLTVPQRMALVRAAVRADPQRTNAEVAGIVGMSTERVRQLRHLARLPSRPAGLPRFHQDGPQGNGA
jgi:hypothetical protein